MSAGRTSGRIWACALGVAACWLIAAAPASGAYSFATEWGSLGAAEGQFFNPIGIGTNGSNVYVSEAEPPGPNANNRVQRFNSNGAFQRMWGRGVDDGTAVPQICTTTCQAGQLGTVEGEFNLPEAVAVDPSGNVWVADSFNNRIQKFSPSGAPLVVWGWGVDDGTAAFQTCTSGCQAGAGGTGLGQFSSPFGIATDAAGNVYVSNLSSSVVQKFSPAGALLNAWGSFGPAEGQFSGAVGLTVDGSGNVYVADQNNHRVQKFDSNGVFVVMWGRGVDDGVGAPQTCAAGCQAGVVGTAGGEFNGPNDVTVDAAGTVLVTDNGNNRVQRFGLGGDFLEIIGAPGAGPGQFNFPSGIDADAAGNAYVVDSNNSRVQKFSEPLPQPPPETSQSTPTITITQPQPTPTTTTGPRKRCKKGFKLKKVKGKKRCVRKKKKR